MKLLSRVSLSILCSAQLALAGNTIQFSADVEEYKGEGIIYRRLTFKDDKRTVNYYPPQGWTVALQGDRLRLTVPDKTFAEGQIESVALEKPEPLDDNIAAELGRQLLGNLPPGSQQGEVLNQDLDTVAFNGQPTREVIVSYKLLGETYRRAALVANTPTTRIIFRFTAKQADFESLYRVFRTSVSSWEWREPAVAAPKQ